MYYTNWIKSGKISTKRVALTYITSQFISKLQVDQHIVLQADQITRLNKVIEAARRIEQFLSNTSTGSQALTLSSLASISTLSN